MHSRHDLVICNKKGIFNIIQFAIDFDFINETEKV